MTATAVLSPYRGLAPFGDTELDALLFFGRGRETEILTANVIATRLTILYGPSGVGKSSLLRAGVARRIRELGARHAVARGPDLACVVCSSWADDPHGALVAAIGDTVRPLLTPTAPEPPSGARLAGVAEHWSSLLDGDLCVVLDQIEELFVYHDDASAFLDELAGVVSDTGLRANVLLSIRDDELARLGLLKDRLPNAFANARRLDRLDRDAARAAILGPLQRWNELAAADEPVDAEPELVDAVLAETAVDTRRVEAPYLQLVMERIWEEEQAVASRLLRLETLEGLGGARAVVREHLGRALGALAPKEQAAAARMFGHLVTPSGTKIAHRASDLATFAQVGDAESHALLEALGRDRIVRPLDDPGPDRRYEIFHDVLAQAIVEWSARRELDEERSGARRRQRRLLAVTVGAVATALVMVAVAVYALTQRSDARAQARHAHGSALAAAALAAMPSDPEVGLRLARAAAADARTSGIESVLRTALDKSRARAVLTGGRQPVLAASFAGGRVVTVDRHGTLRMYAPRTGGPSSTRHLLRRVRAAAIAADGSAVAVAARRLVEVLSLGSPRRSFAVRVRSPVRALATDGRGDRVAVATLDGRVLVRGAAGVVLDARARTVQTSLALDDDGRAVAGGAGHAVTVWRVGGRATRIDTGNDVNRVALAPDGTLVAAAGSDGGVRLWRVADGASAGPLGLTPSPPTAIAFARDGRSFAVGSRDGIARVFETETGRLQTVLSGHRAVVTSVAFSRNGYALVAGAADGRARIWESGLTPELSVVARPRGCCAALASADGRVLVAAGRRTIEYAGRRRAAVLTQPSVVTSVASAGGGTVVTGGRDGRVRVWASPRWSFSLGAPISAVAATPAVIAAATDAGRIEVRSLHDDRIAVFRQPAGVAGLAVSPDGRLLATAGLDGVGRIRDLRTGRLLHGLFGHTAPLTSVAFTPDGTMLATAGKDHDIRVWDVASGSQLYLLRAAHFAAVSGVAFSPDGRWLVSAGPTTAGLWYAKSGVRVAYLRGHEEPLVGAVFAGSARIVTASVDGSVRAFRCDICGGFAELVALADRRVAATGGALTPAEQRRYLVP
ncbi:MAG: hypothetical protein ACJ77E_21195 [Gaiellaceae bacterium]